MSGQKPATCELRTAAQGASRTLSEHQVATALQVRGLVTYCGPGTLFLDDQEMDRPGSGFMRFLGVDKQGHAVRRHGAVLQADAGDVLLLKGRHYPGNAGA